MTKGMMLGILAFIVAVLLYLSVFTVKEGQSALILRLGELQTNPTTNKAEVYNPGLHFKMPFVTTDLKFDVRLQTLNVESSRILTAEQKHVIVDYYAKWRIANLPLYYKRTGGFPLRAQLLLKQQINDALRAAFGKRKIAEVISGERLNIMSILQKKANLSAKELGIQVTDVRIVSIDLPKEVRESVFQRMRSEREQVATKHRSDGKAKAESLQANADATVAVTIAKAKTQAQIIRAKGDEQAAAIYSKAYQKNAQFYAFYRSLEAYRQVFKKNTVMVLRPNTEFFKYFNKAANGAKR